MMTLRGKRLRYVDTSYKNADLLLRNHAILTKRSTLSGTCIGLPDSVGIRGHNIHFLNNSWV